MEPWTWEGLARATLHRQFPAVPGRGPDAVVELLGRVGPVQSQAPRAPFLTASARLPGVSRAAVTEAHQSRDLVRSTSLRGTVHTCTREQHPALEAVATRSRSTLWRRTLRLRQDDLDRFWDALESLTESDWETYDVLEGEMLRWLGAQGLDATAVAVCTQPGRAAFRSHPAMLRRPLGSGWESGGAVAYRASRYVLDAGSVDPQHALVQIVRRHLVASGPATRRDLAWWSGEGLRNVDAAIAAIRPELVVRPGPNGLDYVDLAEPPTGGDADPGLRLLPEFDALLLGYDSKARQRFVDLEAIGHLWNRANGMHSPSVLVDGRLRGRWRLERGPGRAAIAVEMFPGERLPDPGDLTDQAAAVGAVLDLSVDDVTVTGNVY